MKLMANLSDLKKFALRLPETSEGTHFRLPVFKVLEKPFVVIQKDNTHSFILLDKPNVIRLRNENPDIFEEVWQSKKYLIGLKINIDKVSTKQLQQMVELAWRNKAPKKLVKEFENDNSLHAK